MTIKGIFTPTVVPFSDGNRINEVELRRYVSWLIEKGISGLYPNGSTGEFVRLTHKQRLRVVEIVTDETRGRVPIIAGAADDNIDLVLESCVHFAEIGCRAASVTAPYYFKVSQSSIEEYFRQIADQSPIDILLYNVPQFANEIDLEVVKRLACDCPRIVGLKDSSRDLPRFLHTLNELKPLRPDFSCLIGCEEILLPALVMGGDGAAIATSGVAPEKVMQLYRSFLDGNLDEAKRIQFGLLELIKTMLAAGNFPDGFRAGVNLRGFAFGRGPHLMGRADFLQLELAQKHLARLIS